MIWPDKSEGPYFDELALGDRFTGAPGVTLTEGQAAVHQAVLGDRLRLPLDHALAAEVIGAATGAGPLAHPAHVWDVAIGQSTVVTHHVRANLFYRGLAFRRYPVLGDTLRTVTEVVGLRENSRRPGRAPTGLAALRITTVDQEDRPVLDFWRCAMLPLRDPSKETGHRDDLSTLGVGTAPSPPLSGWDLARFRSRVPGEHFADLAVGRSWEVVGADVVSSAPELARLTVNIAVAHHDSASAGGQRLVYGGHTIGLALSQVCRAIPNIVTVAGWEGCDHLGPVHEGDSLTSRVEVTGMEAGGLVHLRSTVEAAEPVLDWRFTVVLAWRELASARTWLFVPGDRPDRFAKAAASGADGVIVDLEDAVAPEAKDAAREHVLRWSGTPSAVVRVNAVDTPWYDADVAALRGVAAALMLPKAERAEDVERTGAVVVPLVETAAGIMAAGELCAAPGVPRTAFGSIDLAAQLGVDPNSRTALLHARSALVLAAAAAGCAPPLDGVTTALDDPDALTSDTAHAVELGFTGKLCVHPRQLEPVHAALRPTDAELTWARSVLAAGKGGATAVDGQLVDRPVLLRAERLLSRGGFPR